MKCDHEGCAREGDPCYLPADERDDPSYHYCAEHAPEEGFCYGCGEFWAGIESFDFGPGLCENCCGDLNEENGFDEDEDGSDEATDDR